MVHDNGESDIKIVVPTLHAFRLPRPYSVQGFSGLALVFMVLGQCFTGPRVVPWWCLDIGASNKFWLDVWCSDLKRYEVN